MDINKFKQAEAQYQELKIQMEKGEINSSEMKTKLKEIMITDDQGNYWMIGGKTGKWYTYTESEWKEENPYKDEAIETQRIFQDETKMAEKEETPPVSEEKEAIVTCRACQATMPVKSLYCQVCGANQKEPVRAETVKPVKAESELLIKSIKLVPMIFFFGGLGLIVGILFGATFGIFDIFGDFIYQFPIMLQETRGKIQGGLIFAAMGGISGFIFFAFISIIMTGIYNFISFFFGGLRFKTKP
jgi:hypothetical protein